MLLRAGLLKNHPDISDEDIAEICDHLNPESIASFAEAFGALAFPLFTAKWRENVNKLRAKGESPKPRARTIFRRPAAHMGRGLGNLSTRSRAFVGRV